MAKGHWGRLIGLQLSVIAIILMVELVLFVVVIAVAMLVASTGATLPDANTSEMPFAVLDAIWATWWPLFAAGGLALCAFYGAVITLSTASQASACLQLAGPKRD